MNDSYKLGLAVASLLFVLVLGFDLLLIGTSKGIGDFGASEIVWLAVMDYFAIYLGLRFKGPGERTIKGFVFEGAAICFLVHPLVLILVLIR